MIQVIRETEPRIRQGDIIANVNYIEDASEKNGEIEIRQILFPLVIVLSQDCDLTWDFNSRVRANPNSNQDKYLLSVMVAPIYNYEHFIGGEHLSELGLRMAAISRDQSKTDNKNIRQNQNPRYHFLEFDQTIPIVNSVIDFKHYFTVNVLALQNRKETEFICSVSELYRELICQRFANYLSRIGLPGQ